MIHQYDYYFGDLLKKSYANAEYKVGFDEHRSSKVFMEFMDKARSKNILVKIDGENKPLSALCKEAQEFLLSLDEETLQAFVDEAENSSKNPQMPIFLRDKKTGEIAAIITI